MLALSLKFRKLLRRRTATLHRIEGAVDLLPEEAEADRAVLKALASAVEQEVWGEREGCCEGRVGIQSCFVAHFVSSEVSKACSKTCSRTHTTSLMSPCPPPRPPPPCPSPPTGMTSGWVMPTPSCGS